MERIIKLNNFKKLNIASAISLAILAVPAQAVVQINGDVQLTDEIYSEALQWTPGTAGNALELNNVTVDTALKGHAGVLVKNANGNDISVNDSHIKGGEKGYALRFDNVSDSNIFLDKTDLSTNGGNSFTYTSNLLSKSNLTFKDSTLTGGQRGISVGNAENGSVITLDNTKINEVNNTGIYVPTLNDSALNILNGSEITSDKNALDANATGSEINVDKSTINGGKTGILTNLNGGSALNISGSTLWGESTGLRASVNDSTVTIDSSTFSGTYGFEFYGHDGDIAISNSQTSGKLYLGGGNMQFDIANSELGSFELKGQGASEDNLKGHNKIDIDSSKLTAVAIMLGGGGAIAGGNTVNLVNSELINAVGVYNNAAIYIQDSNNNTVNLKDSIIKGDIMNAIYYDESTETTDNTINIDNSHFEGAIITHLDPDGSPNPDLGSVTNIGNNTTWVAKGKSNAETLNITDSTVDIKDAIVGADTWHSENTDVLINSESQLNIDTGSGDINIKIQSDGKEMETAGKDIINIKNGDIDIQADDVDLGGYKYKLVEKDGKWVLERLEVKDWTELEGSTAGGENWVELEDGTIVVLSNSANAVLSSLAAAQTSWNSQTGAVYERLNSRMELDEGSVWGTYYGNEWAGEAGLSSTFNQKINGLAIGADKTLPLKDGQFTMGVAVMHDNSHLSGFDEKGSGGSMTSTAVHAYGRLGMDNGLFFKGTASAGSASSKLNANSSDGSVAKGEYKQSLFGLTGQAGYRYQVTPEVYVAPYVQMNGYTASEAKFGLDNGMDVKSDRYWSARGELGVEAGVNTSIAGIAVTPHVMAAAGHEFVKNNDVHLNGAGTAFNNTVDGSGYKLGAGIEAQMTKNLSAGINVNYSRSEDVEQRFGVQAGIRYGF